MQSASVTAIDVAYPEAGDLHLRIAVGACRLKIAPGGGEAWVSGTYDDPSGALPSRVSQDGGSVRITQEYDRINVLGWLNQIPTFDLALGKARPFSLTIESGASENEIDLGGVPVIRLVAKHGAGKMAVHFSAPNLQAMSLLNLGSGAGTIELTNLANANFAEMVVEGGAASYRCDFGGRLQRDAHARITTGLSAVEVSVPAGTAAKIASESLIGGIDIGDGFTKKEGAFWTEAAVRGSTPVLTIRTSVALGSLNIRVT